MSTDGSGAHVIALPPKGHYGLYEPRFSPTGLRVAVLASKGRGTSLWIMRADGSRLHEVLDHVSGLDWSVTRWHASARVEQDLVGSEGARSPDLRLVRAAETP